MTKLPYEIIDYILKIKYKLIFNDLIKEFNNICNEYKIYLNNYHLSRYNFWMEITPKNFYKPTFKLNYFILNFKNNFDYIKNISNITRLHLIKVNKLK